MRHLRRSRGGWGIITSQGLEHLLIDFGCEKLDNINLIEFGFVFIDWIFAM